MSLAVEPLQIGGLPGGPELLIILLLAVLLFGASKIPKLARSTGQALGEFQRGRIEAEEELQQIREETVGSEGSTEAGTGAEPETGAAAEAERAETETEAETATESE